MSHNIQLCSSPHNYSLSIISTCLFLYIFFHIHTPFLFSFFLIQFSFFIPTLRKLSGYFSFYFFFEMYEVSFEALTNDSLLKFSFASKRVSITDFWSSWTFRSLEIGLSVHQINIWFFRFRSSYEVRLSWRFISRLKNSLIIKNLFQFSQTDILLELKKFFISVKKGTLQLTSRTPEKATNFWSSSGKQDDNTYGAVDL